MHLCINMLIFTHNLGNWLIMYAFAGRVHFKQVIFDLVATFTF